MTHLSTTAPSVAEQASTITERRRSVTSGARWKAVPLTGAAIALLTAGGGVAWWHATGSAALPSAPPPLPRVTVSEPLQQVVAATTGFLGQFSAVDTVELRAQVGGTLTRIGFADGQIVHKGDLLFTIDPRPYEIKLEQAVAQFQTSQAKETLSEAELWRAQQLKKSDYGTAENVDQRAADQRNAQAAIAAAKGAIRDAQLDLEFAQITAPFTGRIGAHLVSVGSLVSGSRGGTSPTTLLATIVSLDPTYLDFDMSEADYLAYRQAHPGSGPQGGEVAISLNGDGRFDRRGMLDFIDNAVNRSSGTIHARATVPNPDFAVTPGQFARLRLVTGKPAPALLVPGEAIVPDQSRETVMTVAADGTVTPKLVQTGDLYHGLRIVRSGLSPSDRVVMNGLMRAIPGAKVTPIKGTIAPGMDGDNR
jgi:RND family efflux transporter MFP subunit